MTIQGNIKTIQDKIDHSKNKSALASQEVTLICVSKYHSVEAAKDVYDNGIRHFAESRPEGLSEKMGNLPDDIVWHYISPLQSRKVKDVINEIDYFHALERIKIAEEIQKRAEHQIKCFVQVNVSSESTKHGLHPDELVSFIEKLSAYPAIEIHGLMTMAPQDADEEMIHQYFQQLRKLRDQIERLQLAYAPCHELSMGMSADYQLAIEEGSTFVRVGSAFFAD